MKKNYHQFPELNFKSCLKMTTYSHDLGYTPSCIKYTKSYTIYLNIEGKFYLLLTASYYKKPVQCDKKVYNYVQCKKQYM